MSFIPYFHYVAKFVTENNKEEDPSKFSTSISASTFATLDGVDYGASSATFKSHHYLNESQFIVLEDEKKIFIFSK